MKPHYPVLDGLRGTAAIQVVLFHLLEGHFTDFVHNPLHHGYLAVDFFFMLSGFVIGYAYDDRWTRMTIKDFFRIRVIRLHPLILLSLVFGGLLFWFDPFLDPARHISLLRLAGVVLFSFTLLPEPDLRAWGETHSLNDPLWTLFQEYIANILYAVYGRKMSRTILWVIVAAGAGALTALAIHRGDLGTGWGYHAVGAAVIRMVFPFFTGLLLFRSGRLIRIRGAYVLCSLLLLLIFALPVSRFNGLYEAACIIFIFPLILAMGAGGQVEGRWAALCRFSGSISYPLYILHYPFIAVYSEWVLVTKPSPAKLVAVAGGLFVFFIGLGYAALRWYDEPVRNWLKRKLPVRA